MEQLSWIGYTCLTLAISFLLTVVMMPQLLKLCRRRDYYDLPNDRKLHSDNIPRLGGVLFAPVMMVGVTASLVVKICLQSMPLPFVSLSVGFVLTGTFLIYLVGLLDDLCGLKASLKFGIQLLVSLLLPFCGLYIHNLCGLFGLYELPCWLAYPLTVFVSLLIVNAIKSN